MVLVAYMSGIKNTLTGALPQLIAAEAALRDYATSLGITYVIADYGGVRTQADTALILSYRAQDYAAAVAANPSVANIPIDEWRPIAPFGSSYHNFGGAFDIDIVSGPPDALNQLKNAAPQFGLRSEVPNDPGHFELDLPLATVQGLWQAQGNTVPGISVEVGNGGDVAAVSTAAIVVALVITLLILRNRR